MLTLEVLLSGHALFYSTAVLVPVSKIKKKTCDCVPSEQMQSNAPNISHIRFVEKIIAAESITSQAEEQQNWGGSEKHFVSAAFPWHFFSPTGMSMASHALLCQHCGTVNMRLVVKPWSNCIPVYTCLAATEHDPKWQSLQLTAIVGKRTLQRSIAHAQSR